MKKLILSSLGLCFSLGLFAQDELLNLVNDGKQKKEKDFTIATFKTTRLYNLHTIETQSKRSMDFRISHRFGDMGLSNGATASNFGYNAFGLDQQASIKLSLEYCFDGRFQIGIGRCSDLKIVDGFAKYRLIRQTTDKGNPVSVTLFAGVYETFIRTGDDYYNTHTFGDRFSFCNQIMIARKFNRRFSLQLGAAHVHYNIVPLSGPHTLADGTVFNGDKNDLLYLTMVTRYKITNRMALTAEYALPLTGSNYNAANTTNNQYYPTMAFGVDIETGGHVFQLAITNSFSLEEPEYFAHTTGNFFNAGIRLGFNLSRVFDL
ncbi:MAG TPA: DUF5777 family beta-barrel protein [Bacteroidia bacterium]|jgi:hypothetical protein|nr:DUF5777 family beta-barrel protein [Bacteroidia bacterium]